MQHAKTFVKQAIKRLGLSDESLVIEVASNRRRSAPKRRRGGHTVPWNQAVEVNVGATARERGVPTVTEFLLAVKERARRENRTAGEVLSDLARQALTQQQRADPRTGPESFYGWRTLRTSGVRRVQRPHRPAA